MRAQEIALEFNKVNSTRAQEIALEFNKVNLTRAQEIALEFNKVSLTRAQEIALEFNKVNLTRAQEIALEFNKVNLKRVQENRGKKIEDVLDVAANLTPQNVKIDDNPTINYIFIDDDELFSNNDLKIEDENYLKDLIQ